MKKRIKKMFIVTVVSMLCLSMISGSVFATSAAMPANNSNVAYDGDPIVVVRGIDFAGLVKEDGSKALAINVGDIFRLLINIIFSSLAGNNEKTVDSIIDFANSLFNDMSRDENGIPANAGVHIPKFLTSADNIDLSGDEWADTAVGLFRSLANKYGGKNIYLYTFDWRCSPSELADDLNSFLTLVKTETGKDKLDIAACSMGGMITTAYIDKYGTDCLDSVVYLSSAHNGGIIVGSAFTGDLVVDNNAIADFLLEKTANNGLVNFLIKILNGNGILDLVVNFLNDFITTNKDRLYNEFLFKNFCTAFGLWGLIPDEYFEASINYFFEGKEESYTYALSEINKVKDFVFRTDEILAKAYADGVKVSFVSHYDSRQLPIYSNFELHGDGVLESEKTSGYGTFAKYGATLSDEELAGVDARYISPDRVVNASTCLYKDTTWIVKGAGHVGCKDNSDHTEFAIWLLTQDLQPTVTTNADYPQFMNVDENENFIEF